jgi:predicted nucleotidyltransferase
VEPDLLNQNILKTLLYYDIFKHPLKKDELFIFCPKNTVPKTEIEIAIDRLSEDEGSKFSQKDGYIYVKPNSEYVDNRLSKEKYSQRMWKITKYVVHIIKRFPYVRAVLVTGSLSKNSSTKESDIDFMVITGKNRLWVARTLLMLFKKIFLLNSYKYFCINYFITEDSLEVDDKNIFTATEVATVKGVFNTELMKKYLNANKWVKDFFPNYNCCDPYLHSPGFKVNNRTSYLQKVQEFFLNGKPGDIINKYFKNVYMKHWEKKYRHMNETERNRIFKSTDAVAKTHPEDMQKFILDKYCEKLRQFNLQING